MAKKNPLEDDDDDKGAEEANRKAVEEVKKKAAEKEEDGEGPIEIAVGDDDDDDDDAPAPPSRREKRANRYREQIERAERAERDRDALNQRIAQLEANLRQPPPAPPGPPEPDPLETELDKVMHEQDVLYQSYQQRAASLSPAEHEAFTKKARDLQRKMLLLGGQMAVRKEGGAQDPQQMRRAMVAERMMQDHGDVISDEKKRMYADGEWRRLVARGAPDNWDTVEKAMEATRDAFGMQRKRPVAPSASLKSKLSGVSKGAGGGAGEGRTTVTMTESYKRMADAMYPSIKDKGARYRLWANKVGRKLVDKTG